ncbi:MAG: hypothetical protein F6K21_32555 [Symploca sp. SIO2D2]|nr:hypothetical protein [Symploca sp. SIO2D2]
MKNENHMQALLRPIILQAQTELLPPEKFYLLCQRLRNQTSIKRFYFLTPPPHLIPLQPHQISPHQLCKFLDRLAHYVSSVSLEGHQELFYLQRVNIRLRGVKEKVVLVKRRVAENQRINIATGMKIEVEIVGAGMIGRVARLRINDGQDLAFKAFFYPDFVWQHGPWAEIPIGIRLKACQVTKDLPEFLFAGQDWAVWEWIYPHTNPQSRKEGITYEQFAQLEGLTKLNYLNRSNYNPYNMRLDPGGIQKKYWGRRFHDFLRGIIFYAKKAHREGFQSLTLYMTGNMVRYLCLRLIALIFPKFIQPHQASSRSLRGRTHP